MNDLPRPKYLDVPPFFGAAIKTLLEFATICIVSGVLARFLGGDFERITGLVTFFVLFIINYNENK